MAARGEYGVSNQKASGDPYEEGLGVLSSLIPRRSSGESCQQFDLMFDYVKILGLEEDLSKMKIIHVAGTKGKLMVDEKLKLFPCMPNHHNLISFSLVDSKGSTCTFTESILRNYGFRTGLLTSPHLIDVRERFRVDGVDISVEKFLAYFWWCYNRFKEATNSEMPSYFLFLTSLSLKIFAAEKVDVVILEVGLGGKYDSTNVVQKPVVCGFSSLGYDHTEILGDTLDKIAGMKAGIFKLGVPAFTVPQPDEAMRVLEDKASELDVNMKVVQPLNKRLLNGHKLGLDGEHQYLNAGLAVSLAYTWLQQSGNLEIPSLHQMTTLPEPFIKGLATASLQGRGQVVPDLYGDPGKLVFYLDGAHTPESMEACAKWFSLAVLVGDEQSEILLFNCTSVRDPQTLFPHLRNTCAKYGVDFEKALFVPNMSMSYKAGMNALLENNDDAWVVDLSWQYAVQKAWESLVGEEEDGGKSEVFSSLPLAIKWLRDTG
ncbi:unnamed protein product [Arabis nemorensis]|uniref:Folylpolyglutamate synthase n=1 Tax=Arabis nemorensis TaxID=586526 RepID=A0A565B7W9_9BRAS|nr:unnamed protein product [Arabis nemorensis]